MRKLCNRPGILVSGQLFSVNVVCKLSEECALLHFFSPLLSPRVRRRETALIETRGMSTDIDRISRLSRLWWLRGDEQSLYCFRSGENNILRSNSVEFFLQTIDSYLVKFGVPGLGILV